MSSAGERNFWTVCEALASSEGLAKKTLEFPISQQPVWQAVFFTESLAESETGSEFVWVVLRFRLLGLLLGFLLLALFLGLFLQSFPVLFGEDFTEGFALVLVPCNRFR